MGILYSVLFMKSEGAVKFLTYLKQATSLPILKSPQKLFKNLSLILDKVREPVCLRFHINLTPLQDKSLPAVLTSLTHPQALYLYYYAPATVAFILLLNMESPTSRGLLALDFQG